MKKEMNVILTVYGALTIIGTAIVYHFFGWSWTNVLYLSIGNLLGGIFSHFTSKD